MAARAKKSPAALERPRGGTSKRTHHENIYIIPRPRPFDKGVEHNGEQSPNWT